MIEAYGKPSMIPYVRAARWTALLALCAACSQPAPLALPSEDVVVDLDGPSMMVGCSPGVSVACMCPGNAIGRRTCTDEGFYTACACVDARVPCFPGAVQGCDCGGFAGIQFCGEDGVFSGCVCPTRDAAVTDGRADAPEVLATDAGMDVGAMDAGMDVAPYDATNVRDAAADAPADIADVCTCLPDATRPCPLPPGQVPQTYTFGRCRRGTQACAGAACWGACVGQVDPINEICNNIDDNCNGLVDDIIVSCGLGRCRRVMQTCDMGRVTPCEPDFAQARPELCNGVDDDCNGMVDDGCRDQ